MIGQNCDVNKGRNSVAKLQKMTLYNPNVELVKKFKKRNFWSKMTFFSQKINFHFFASNGIFQPVEYGFENKTEF